MVQRKASQKSEGSETIEVHAESDARFILATAAPDPYPLVAQYGQIHTRPEALSQGAARIKELGTQLYKKRKS